MILYCNIGQFFCNSRYVGDRLGSAAYNTVYGGKKAYTGPT